MLLGLDLGTTNVKALLVTETGQVRSQGSAPVSLRHTTDGGVEQDIEEIWQATLEAIGEAGREQDLSAVKAIGISSQGGALQIRQADGTCVGPVISWMDGRGQRFDQNLNERMGLQWFAERIGHAGSGVAIGQILRLRETQPELLASPNRIGFVGDTIVGRLCGRPVHDGSSLSICNLYNPTTGQADPEVLDLLGIEAGQLPDLLDVREPAGGLLPEVADQTNLPAGVPVSVALHDQYAAALGCGAVKPGQVMFGAGTAWVLLAAADRPMAPVGPWGWVCRHAVPGTWGQLLSLIVGGSAFRWALETTRLTEVSADEIDTLLASVPAGSDGVRVYPFHDGMGGPHRPAGGAVRGLKLAHGPAHLLRATVEGLCCELTRQLGWLTEAGCPAAELIMCGGSAKTRCTPQMVADITGRPVLCPDQSEVSGFGAAVLARALCDTDKPLARLAAEMASTTQKLDPGPDAKAYADQVADYIRAVEPTDD